MPNAHANLPCFVLAGVATLTIIASCAEVSIRASVSALATANLILPECDGHICGRATFAQADRKIQELWNAKGSSHSPRYDAVNAGMGGSRCLDRPFGSIVWIQKCK
jgi:hypothetical protein